VKFCRDTNVPHPAEKELQIPLLKLRITFDAGPDVATAMDMFHGFIPMKLMELYSKSPDKRDQWGAKLIELLWESAHELWELRNEELHGNNSYANQRKRVIVIEAAAKLIAYGEEEMDHEDRQLLLPLNKEQFLESNTKTLEAWMQTNRPAILKAANDNASSQSNQHC
jgi:hypothetical protein